MSRSTLHPSSLIPKPREWLALVPAMALAAAVALGPAEAAASVPSEPPSVSSESGTGCAVSGRVRLGGVLVVFGLFVLAAARRRERTRA